LPIAKSHPLLKAVYLEASRLIAARSVPTELVAATRTLYRSFDRKYLTVTSAGIFPRKDANQALVVRDQGTDQNRFSGQSFSGGIKPYGGLYCSLQQSAQINELLHYARNSPHIPRSPRTGYPKVDDTLDTKCIVKIRMMSPVLAADISLHNSAAPAFLDEIGRSSDVQLALRIAAYSRRSMWEVLNDSTDCSMARGIGLAVANSSYLQALQATTARPSDRSPEEAGDNLVFFGADSQPVPSLWVEEAYVFPVSGPPLVYPVQFA
jgi:hypothetical protein